MFILVSTSISRNLDAPVITCLEVHEAGDVTIYWQSLDLTVQEFRIFYSTNNVDYFQAGSVDSQNSSLQFHHTLAQANNQIYYYYIKAIYSTLEVDSEVFRTMFLGVGPFNGQDFIAEVSWYSVRDPLPEGSSVFYYIYQSIYNGSAPVWALIDSTINNSYYDTIADGLCSDSINYKIEISNSYGCSSVSNVAGDWFSEFRQPEQPIFDSISINSSGNIILGWEPSTSKDAAGTIIYLFDNNNARFPIDTVYDNQISHYTDTIRKPCDNSNIRYAIAAIDSCGVKSPATFFTPIRPIFINNPTYNICSATNYLSWESYINAVPDIEKYQILASLDNGPFEIVGDVSGTSTTYDHSNVIGSSDYSYYVRAVFGNFTSTSCLKSIRTGNYTIPQNLYLANADVQINNRIDLVIDIDLIPNSCSWSISRSNPGGGNQSVLDSFNRSEVTANPFFYTDSTADGSVGLYDYSVSVFDSCSNLAIQSNTLETIFLNGTPVSDNINQLTWNSFTGWDGDIVKYYIFRYSGDIIPSTPFDSLIITDANILSHIIIDDVSSISTAISDFNYWIRAVEGTNNSYLYQEKSNSNIVSFYRETELYMPNAFRPSGVNNVFKPVTTGFGGTSYLFQIYNRWGQKIFETNEPSIGWDGTSSGNKASQGTYIYRLVYNSVFGEVKTQQGHVTLID